ncbi:uncharacterized protein SPPG_03199 [Spizellomyces punctatus DAOM BR117]|uniref:Transmembrane protein n=1 Tax=Spizellomyces punctatus (strain DAOM BR117) TaxID=645134 RepID=A0A0L0HK26_SPIPD|nr:uncharacterized protein SPPG_03199 [Spizellomyces punctatus DAOM BR117]KND01388.1 hypothetical protein SPPG_03199 [Spizellomyces punctatus DAOM BR117]|eukprot:XP_016609427.1 hypothetical protein SPPG_03199 [Spizellomyces punctatus DAOM BR117]
MRDSLPSQLSTYLQTQLDKTAKHVFPSYRNLEAAGAHRRTPIDGPISSNLPLQVLLYFNLWMFPFWAIGMVITVHWKMKSFMLRSFHRFMIGFLLAVFIPVEIARLWLGYSGNLRERVPELAGCFLFTLFPQVLVAAYYTALQPFTGSGFATPFEMGLNIVYLLFLIPEAVFAYRAAQNIVQSQSARFFLTAPVRDDYGQNVDDRASVDSDMTVAGGGSGRSRRLAMEATHRG